MHNLYKWLLVLAPLSVFLLFPVVFAVFVPEKIIAASALMLSVFALVISITSSNIFKIFGVKLEIEPTTADSDPLCVYKVMAHNYKSSSIFISKVCVRNCLDHFDSRNEDSLWLSKGKSCFKMYLNPINGVVHPGENKCVFCFKAPLSVYPYIGYRDTSRKVLEIQLTFK